MDRVKVFIANAAGHDYRAAERYGEIRYVIKGYISFQSLDRLKYSIATNLKEATKNDWLCISGTSVINVLAAVIWFHKFGIVKLLIWDKKFENTGTGRYREVILSAENLQELIKQL